jgi:hypothetical protein
MAMPWKKGKAKAAAIRADMTGEKLDKLNQLFNACFRIQREACEAAGHHIPMVVENVRGAQPWVGRAKWNFGSFYLWGDVPALMPITASRTKAPKPGTGNQLSAIRPDQFREGVEGVKVTTMGAGWYPPGHPKHVAGLAFNGHAERNLKGRKTDGAPHIRDGEGHTKHLTNPGEHEGVKAGAAYRGACSGWGVAQHTASKSKARKAASATIAKIPLVLARWIGATYRPVTP